MKQNDIVKIIAKETGYDQEIVRTIYVQTFKTIKDRIAFGLEVKIFEFCNLRKERAEARTYRTPQGKEKHVPAHYKLRAVFSKAFKDELKKQPVY